MTRAVFFTTDRIDTVNAFQILGNKNIQGSELFKNGKSDVNEFNYYFFYSESKNYNLVSPLYHFFHISLD